MWERLGFYLMLGIMVLYATDTERGGLGLSLTTAGEIYGTYLAFVYFTPFLGGMIADRFLGFRRSVLIGGLCMSAGYFMLGVRDFNTFVGGLVLLCVGNGLFKPNISAMVGNLYEPGDPKRDTGFNIFYMGINIGASFSAILAAPLRNKWGFNLAFMAAGVGLLIGVMVLIAYWKKLAPADRMSERSPDDVGFGKICLTILLPAAIFGFGGYHLGEEIPLVVDTIGPITFAFIVGMLPIIAYFVFLVVRATPEEKPGLGALMPVFIAGGTFFMILHLSGGLMTIFAENYTDRRAEWIPGFMSTYRQKAMPSYFDNADSDVPRPDRRMLIPVGDDVADMFGQKRIGESLIASVRAKHPELVILDVKKDEAKVQADWSDLVCKVFKDENIKIAREKDAHGHETVTVKIEPETAKSLASVVFTRVIDGKHVPVLLVTQPVIDSVYAKASESRLPSGRFLGLMNAELITGLLNPIFVVLLTPLVVAFFAWRVRRKRGVTTAKKIFYGMVITTISIAIMAWGAYLGGNGLSKVSVMWLVVYYLIITVGELCLSPMGLSLVTKLSPKRLVGLMMGGWFLSTAIGNKLAGFISGLEPTWQMFLILGAATLLVAGFLFALLPRLNAAIKKYGA
jgi:POT family proton-dependent oligopeptide transporter